MRTRFEADWRPEADWERFMTSCIDRRVLDRMRSRVGRIPVATRAAPGRRSSGKARTALLLWLLGVPLPLILLFYALRGCN